MYKKIEKYKNVYKNNDVIVSTILQNNIKAKPTILSSLTSHV